MEKFEPAYASFPSEELKRRTEQARELMSPCRLCPRQCLVDRTAGERGFCGILDSAVIASHGPHLGEEAPLVGRSGSGTIFFSGCNLACLFCQNHDISRSGADGEPAGRLVSAPELADIMLGLKRQGCLNINLVSPTHQAPMIMEALGLAAREGLDLPVVWNTGGYDSLETLALLEGLVDIYMPDLKYMDPETGLRLSEVEDYPRRAQEAIREMHRQVGDLGLDDRGIAGRGLMVRHLVLPGGLAGTREAMRFIASEISRDTYVNIMDQYRPCHLARGVQELSRRPAEGEMEEALGEARRAGLWRIDGYFDPLESRPL